MSMDDLRHPDCRYCDEYKRLLRGPTEEVRQLKARVQELEKSAGASEKCRCAENHPASQGEEREPMNRTPIIQPGEEWEAARAVIGAEISDPAGFAASDLLHRVIDAVEGVRYAGVKPRPIGEPPMSKGNEQVEAVAMCTNAGCDETATRVMSMPPTPEVRCHFAAPYCDEHAEEVRSMGGLPVAGPALSEQAQQIGGIR